MLFDSHCHLDVAEFDADRESVIAHCVELGIEGMVIPAIDEAGWSGLLALCRRHRGLYPALGLHPMFLDRHREGALDALAEQVSRERPVAIGEIGLDFFIQEADQIAQQALFEGQLAIARDAGLPVILHVRKAHDPTLALLRRVGVVGGTAHAFNGSLQQARHYIDLGFKLGFGGMLTYENARHLRELAVELPLESILLETDAPDMSPVTHRGERNSPAYLPEVVAILAHLRGESAERIAEQTAANARELFAIDP